MSDIYQYAFDSINLKKISKAPYGKDWPVVYILKNSTEIYIGETVDARNRFKQHLDNPLRRVLTKALIISDTEYNKSAALDIESRLIEYIAADGKFTLQNGNKGLSDHSYYNKELYRSKFENIIWKKLQDIGIANHNLIQLENSDLFKYSPYKALTDEQLSIVKDIVFDIKANDKQTILINGEPGTGKSVLAIYLAKLLTHQKSTSHLKIALVIPMTSLRKTLKKVFSKIKGLDSSMVIGPSDVVGKNYDLLIIDESHRLRRRINLSGYGPFDKANKYYGLDNEGTQLDWIMHASKKQVLLYDKNLSVVPGDIRADQISKLNAKIYELTNQLRVKGGERYIQFINSLLSKQVTTTPDFEDYDFRYFINLKDMVSEIKKLNTEHSLARMVAGYAWKWNTKDSKNDNDFDIEIDGLKLRWNSRNIDWVNSPNAINEVGCIHTVQGYDLNYVGVIVGPELSYDVQTNRIVVDKNKYMDFNGKRSITDDGELEGYILNIYKTLLTRGIKGTFIHCVDKNLEKYILERI